MRSRTFTVVTLFFLFGSMLPAAAQRRRDFSTANQALTTGAQEKPPSESQNNPIEVLSSYYGAINEKQYRQAYSYWENPATNLEQFSRGFADTERVRLWVDPTTSIEGAAGSLFAEIPAVIVAHQRAGNDRVFVGCYVLRKSNVVDSGWHIYRANLAPASPGKSLPALLTQPCSK